MTSCLTAKTLRTGAQHGRDDNDDDVAGDAPFHPLDIGGPLSWSSAVPAQSVFVATTGNHTSHVKPPAPDRRYTFQVDLEQGSRRDSTCELIEATGLVADWDLLVKSERASKCVRRRTPSVLSGQALGSFDRAPGRRRLLPPVTRTMMMPADGCCRYRRAALVGGWTMERGPRTSEPTSRAAPHPLHSLPEQAV